MTPGAKKVAWIVGLVAGATGLGFGIWYVTKPKALPQGGGGGGGSIPTNGGAVGGGTGSGGGVLPQSPGGVNTFNPPAPKPYETTQGRQGSFSAYVAANSQLLNPDGSV